MSLHGDTLTHLDKCHLLQATLPGQELSWVITRGPFHLTLFWDSVCHKCVFVVCV